MKGNETNAPEGVHQATRAEQRSHAEKYRLRHGSFVQPGGHWTETAE